MKIALEELYRILLGIILIMVAVLIIGTLFGLTKGSVNRQFSQAVETNQNDVIEESYFTGLGRIRAQTAAPKQATVLVTIIFPYNKQDIAFTEELSSHIPQFKEITIAYFASQSAECLKKLGESAIKDELLLRFNKQLRLGKIETLFFNDYLVID
ncbi:flagellar basal body-associated FliL family protein [Gracilinema caldarium]|nr:flagellar basal body-associated FliL family protein [Gracilinema caldarium]